MDRDQNRQCRGRSHYSACLSHSRKRRIHGSRRGSDYFAYHPTGGLGVSDKKIAKERGEVVAFLKATLKARQRYLNDREAGIKAIIKHSGLTDKSLAGETYEEYRRDLSPDGLADEQWMKKAMEFILKVTGTQEQISPAKVFDFSLTRDAIAQMK